MTYGKGYPEHTPVTSVQTGRVSVVCRFLHLKPSPGSRTKFRFYTINKLAHDGTAHQRFTSKGVEGLLNVLGVFGSGRRAVMGADPDCEPQ